MDAGKLCHLLQRNNPTFALAQLSLVLVLTAAP
jgi:hypothetical protein